MNAQFSPSTVAAAHARRQAAEAAAHAEAGRAARHFMDVCDAVRPAAHVTLRAEPTMAEAVAEIRTRGPQRPLDYVAREALHPAPAPAAPWVRLGLLPIAFLAGLLLGLGF